MNTQPPVQDSDRSNLLGMLGISAPHILVLLLSGQSMQSPHHPGMRHPARQPTRVQLSKAREDNTFTKENLGRIFNTSRWSLEHWEHHICTGLPPAHLPSIQGLHHGVPLQIRKTKFLGAQDVPA